MGCRSDLRKRLESHNNGKVLSTKDRRPFDLIYYEASLHEEDALNRERYLKTTYGHRYIRNRIKHYLQVTQGLGYGRFHFNDKLKLTGDECRYLSKDIESSEKLLYALYISYLCNRFIINVIRDF